MGKRYVVELELDEEQVAALEQAQGLAGELRALLMESAGALRGYAARRGQIEGLHERLSGLTPLLGWMLLEARVAPGEEARQDVPTREVAAVPRKRPAPPAPAAPTPAAPTPVAPAPAVPAAAKHVDLEAARAAFERALQKEQRVAAPTEDRAVVVGRLEGLAPAPAPPRKGKAEVLPDDEALDALRKRFSEPAPAEAPAPEPPPRGGDQHRLSEMVAGFGNSPQDLAANPGSEIGQILSGLTRVSTKQWKSLQGRSRLALAAYLVARLQAARHMASRLERGGSKHADRVRQALMQLRRLCGNEATRVPGLVSEVAPPEGSWQDAALALRATIDAYIAAGEPLGQFEPPPRPAPQASPAPTPAQQAAQLLSPLPPAAPRPPADELLRRIYVRLQAGELSEAQLGVALGELLEAGVKPTETRIINLAERVDERHINGKEFKALRAALRKRRKESEAGEDDAPAFAPPAEWPLWERVRGKRMVILGGDRRPERAEAIQQTFELAEVDWIECREDSPRPVQTLVERIRNQTVDLVVVLQRYVTHSHSDAVFAAEQGSCRVLMAHSYGLQNVMHGLERFLGAGE